MHVCISDRGTCRVINSLTRWRVRSSIPDPHRRLGMEAAFHPRLRADGDAVGRKRSRLQSLRGRRLERDQICRSQTHQGGTKKLRNGLVFSRSHAMLVGPSVKLCFFGVYRHWNEGSKVERKKKKERKKERRKKGK